MYRLSSNSTLFWKLFFPIFYGTFFGILTIVSFNADGSDLPFLANPITRVVLLISYLIFITLIYFTVGQLKRVEADADHLYVCNYIKTFRYLKTDIQSIKTTDFILFKLTTIVMKEKTALGKKISFIGDWDSQKG